MLGRIYNPMQKRWKILEADEEKVNGEEEVMPGIVRRRKSEAYLYQYGQNQATFFQEPV